MPSKLLIIDKIKQKSELSDLDESLILDTLDDYLKKYKIELKNLKKSEIKIITKEIRAQLRLYVGRFQKGKKKRKILLEQNKINELLETHTSTSERISFYPKLKKEIQSLNVNSILDLACGLNPLALANPKIKYFASDIKKEELELIKIYFKKNKIQGKVFTYNLRRPIGELPKTDLCLIFKVLDIIETKNHKIANTIIKKLKCKYILISFSTKTISGKPMSHPRRLWLEKLLKNQNLSFKTFSSENEIFYLVNKTKI